MAEGNKAQEKSLEELEREITCAICQEYYIEPKILPCLHYYCKQCVLRLALREDPGEPFPCPECRCETTLPEGGVDELKTAFFVNRFKSKVTSLERTQGNVEVKCELCEGSSSGAEAFCRQCTRFICQECVDLHKKITIFKLHEVVTLEDLKHGRAQPVPLQEPPTMKCMSHEEPLNIYCYDCDVLLCRDCTVKDHREHTFEFTKKASPSERSKLLEELKPLKDLQAKLNSAVEKIQTAKNEVESQEGVTIDTIKTSFKELHNILEKCEKELIEEAAAVAQEKVTTLSMQEKTLSTAGAEVQGVVEYTERCLSHCTDNEIMGMFKEMKKKIQQKVEEHSKSEMSWEPKEKPDMGAEVRCAEALQQLCKTEATIVKLEPIDPAKCTVQLDESTEVGRLSMGTLTTRLSNNVLAKRNCKVTCQLQSLHNNAITDCTISDDDSGIYSILYTPTDRGRHKLIVLIDEQHVAGSPFPVFVSMHPTGLSQPVEVWEGVRKPVGITVNSKGDILVAERDGGIIKLGASGSLVELVSTTNLKVLMNIAVDDEDKIYCIDNESDKILTCDANGETSKVHRVKLEKGEGRRAIYIKQNIFINERGSDTIIVYSKDLKSLRRIHNPNITLTSAMSPDSHGNIYLTSHKKAIVQVFNADGKFLRYICKDKKKLKDPWGVCVSGQYVYVANYDFIAVFTTNGVHVTSFGQYGTETGEFVTLYNMCADRDGFLYVCDHSNNRIQCF